MSGGRRGTAQPTHTRVNREIIMYGRPLKWSSCFFFAADPFRPQSRRPVQTMDGTLFVVWWLPIIDKGLWPLTALATTASEWRSHRLPLTVSTLSSSTLQESSLLAYVLHSPDNSASQAGRKQNPPHRAWTLHRETCCFKRTPSASVIGHCDVHQHERSDHETINQPPSRAASLLS